MSNCQNNLNLVLLTKLKIITNYPTLNKQNQKTVNIWNKTLTAVYI